MRVDGVHPFFVTAWDSVLEVSRNLFIICGYLGGWFILGYKQGCYEPVTRGLRAGAPVGLDGSGPAGLGYARPHPHSLLPT